MRPSISDNAMVLAEVLLYVHRNRRLIRGRSLGRPPHVIPVIGPTILARRGGPPVQRYGAG